MLDITILGNLGHIEETTDTSSFHNKNKCNRN